MKIHIVQKGDTLWEIAQKYSVDFQTLVQLNSHLASPEMIMPGMKIKVPADAKMIKKDGKKFEQKAVKPKKDMTHKKDMKTDQPKKIEVPKLPKLPEEKAVTLPALDGAEEHYPTTMFPEMPVEQEKVKYQEPKKEHTQPLQPPEQQPAYQMPNQHAYHPQAQMAPPYYYPVMVPQQMGCGCCGQQMHMPYYPYPMYARQQAPIETESYNHSQMSNLPNQEMQMYPAPPSSSENDSK